MLRSKSTRLGKYIAKMQNGEDIIMHVLIVENSVTVLLLTTTIPDASAFSTRTRFISMVVPYFESTGSAFLVHS